MAVNMRKSIAGAGLIFVRIDGDGETMVEHAIITPNAKNVRKGVPPCNSY